MKIVLASRDDITEMRKVKMPDGVTLQLKVAPKPLKGVEIVLIFVEKQKQGTGTKVMKTLVSHADKKGIALCLNPSPIGKGMSQSKLESWYKKFGFVDAHAKVEYYLERQPK